MKYCTLSLLLLFVSIHPAVAQLTIGFSSEEGYKDGPLHQQPNQREGWREQRPGSYVVDADQGSIKFDSSAQPWSVTTLRQPLGFGKVYIIAIEFQITVGSPRLSGNNASMMGRFNLSGEDGAVGAVFRQNARQPNLFDLRMVTEIGKSSPPYPNVQSPAFSGNEIGLRANSAGTAYEKNISDRLRLVLVHRHDGNGSSFTSVAALTNLETGAEISRIVLPDWKSTEDWLKQANKNFSMSTGNMNRMSGDDGKTSIIINNLRIGVGME